MASQTEKVTTRFQRLLKETKLLLMPGGFSPVAARMVEVAGLESFFLAGSQVSAQIRGLPDVGLMGREEMAPATQRVTTACNIPVLVDADTGYGNALPVAPITRRSRPRIRCVMPRPASRRLRCDSSIILRSVGVGAWHRRISLTAPRR